MAAICRSAIVQQLAVVGSQCLADLQYRGNRPQTTGFGLSGLAELVELVCIHCFQGT